VSAFDAWLFLDWSANSTPKIGRDSIWIGEAVRIGARTMLRPPINPATRAEASEAIAARLASHVAARRRVLIGCDFAYGYPSGFAAALGLRGPDPPWRRTWRALASRITDAPDNANNRWQVAIDLNRRLGGPAGPFWACPAASATRELCIGKGRFPHVTRAGKPLAEYRIVDLRLRASKRTVQSVWKLFTTGSVGSQSLLGIPRLQALTRHPRLAPWSRVWPLETGFTDRITPETGPCIVHAEVWPRIIPDDGDPAMVLDARQVSALARHFADLDSHGKLAPLFDRPPDLTDAEIETICREECWVLGT
jgi:precorrin-8X/cobalt-precorrin-8 methylmutase